MQHNTESKNNKGPKKGLPLDSNDMAILSFIRSNPFDAGPKSISTGTKIAERTVQEHLKKLKQMEIIRNVTEIDLAAIGFPLRFRIDIKINPRDLQENRELLHHKEVKTRAEREGIRNPQQVLALYLMHVLPQEYPALVIENVAILLGDPTDLCMFVRSKDYESIFDFVTNGLRQVLGIDNTSTCHEAWAVIPPFSAST